MAFLDWIHDQLTILAEAFGEPLTQERAEIYVGSLSDISQDHLRVAFHRVLNQSTFFPKVAELRNLAGASAEDEKKVEAQAAWNYANEYLRKWGAEKLPIRSSGQWITAPSLEPRLEYALRQIGGLWRLNQVTDQTYPFVFRDFCEAYALAPVAELMAPQLLEQFGDRKLLGNIKQLAEVKEPGRRAASEESKTTEESVEGEELRVVEELTPERKAELRRQLERELAKRGIPRVAAGLD
ncbi:MAG: hypothetical protein WCA49_01175 [Candidatus Sulfotelmatobacter sp.]